MWTTPAGARPSGSSMTIAKLFVPSGAPDQASGGEIFSPTQFGLRCLSAQAFLTASWSLSRLACPAASGRGTVLVHDATASPHSKARQILVTFHDTLPRRGPTQPT